MREQARADGSLRRALLAEIPEDDPVSRELAVRLAELADGRGAAAVAACRALGELMAAQRDDPTLTR